MRRLRLTRVRGVPLPSEALSLGDLFGGHATCNDVATTDGGLSLRTGESWGREVVPHVRLHVVPQD